MRQSGISYRFASFYLNYLETPVNIVENIDQQNSIYPLTQFCQLGITISRKAVRKAHNRNRIKRLIREKFRHEQKTLQGKIVIVVFREIAENHLQKELDYAFNKISKLKLNIK